MCFFCIISMVYLQHRKIDTVSAALQHVLCCACIARLRRLRRALFDAQARGQCRASWQISQQICGQIFFCDVRRVTRCQTLSGNVRRCQTLYTLSDAVRRCQTRYTMSGDVRRCQTRYTMSGAVRRCQACCAMSGVLRDVRRCQARYAQKNRA